MTTIAMSGRSVIGSLALISMASIAALLLLIQSGYSQSTPKASPQDVEAVTKWLKENAVPLKSVQAGAGFEDLQPLKKALKGVRVIGLGEATHGTREFFQFKHRMLEFLVKEMGFTVFALEASYPACLSINDYVVHGKGDKELALLDQGMWVWSTQEMMALIDWMREYNKNLPEAKRIKFLGYDMPDYDDGYKRVAAYLRRVAPDYFEKTAADSLPASVSIFALPQMKDEEKQKLRTKIGGLIEFLTANRERLTRASSAEEYKQVLQCAHIMDQFAETYSLPSFKENDPANSQFGKRDYYMARNIEFILNSEGPETRVAVWAHNGHILADKIMGTIPAMGNHLRQKLGNAYYALGFSFNQGGFQSINMDREDKANKGIIEFQATPASEGTIDWYLARPGIRDYVVDFRSSPKPPQVAEWLSTARGLRLYGSGFSNKWSEPLTPTVLKDHYDGMAFIGTGTRARLMIKQPNLRQDLLFKLSVYQNRRKPISQMEAQGAAIDPAEQERLAYVEKIYTEHLQNTIKEHGWPGRSLVAKDGANAAFQLVLNMEADPELRKLALEPLRKAVEAGDAPKEELAYMTDKIRVKEGKPQLYGTFLTRKDGKLTPHPIEDEANVDQRRAAMGLGALAEYVRSANGVK